MNGFYGGAPVDVCPLIIADAEDKIIFENNAARKLTRSTLVGKNVVDILDGGDYARYRKALSSRGEARGVFLTEINKRKTAAAFERRFLCGYEIRIFALPSADGAFPTEVFSGAAPSAYPSYRAAAPAALAGEGSVGFADMYGVWNALNICFDAPLGEERCSALGVRGLFDFWRATLADTLPEITADIAFTDKTRGEDIYPALSPDTFFVLVSALTSFLSTIGGGTVNIVLSAENGATLEFSAPVASTLVLRGEEFTPALFATFGGSAFSAALAYTVAHRAGLSLTMNAETDKIKFALSLARVDPAAYGFKADALLRAERSAAEAAAMLL